MEKKRGESIKKGRPIRKIDVFCGNIVECPTLTIVNASNTEIVLGSGVSRA
jgi:O-acetyl-ADP-ribose deacetylase (regulator of RNase III)